jgi:hypothetical protein
MISGVSLRRSPVNARATLSSGIVEAIGNQFYLEAAQCGWVANAALA